MLLSGPAPTILNHHLRHLVLVTALTPFKSRWLTTRTMTYLSFFDLFVKNVPHTESLHPTSRILGTPKHFSENPSSITADHQAFSGFLSASILLLLRSVSSEIYE